MIWLLVVLFGLIIGSFLNVCIARLPLEQSIVLPRSRCPRCGASISWYDNIPVVSWLLLRAKCRACGQPISWKYPLVELLNAGLYIWAAREFGFTGEGLLVMAFCSSLIVITFIDFDHQIIPDVITLPGMLIGLALAPLVMTHLIAPLPFHLERMLPHGLYWIALVNSLIGLLAGGAPLFLIGWLWEKLRNVEAMGGGDVKLMAMVGTLIGWKGVLLAIMFGAVSGSIVGVTLIALKKHEADKVIPFGPYLALGSLASLFYGFDIMIWYLGLFRL